MEDRPQPQTAFAWPIYADATLAGLAVLVPVPGLDWWLEERFRRRMPKAIARYNGRPLPQPVLRALNTSSRGCLTFGLTLLLKLPVEILKRLSRKILYVLTLKDATDKLSYYWQRAFLLNYMLTADHLTTVESALHARQAMEHVLKTTPTPLRRLARTVLQSTRHMRHALRLGRRGYEAEVLPQQQATMRQQWGQYEAALRTLAARYEHAYRARVSAREPGK